MLCWYRYVLLQQEDADSALKTASNRREAAEGECEKVCGIQSGSAMHLGVGMAQRYTVLNASFWGRMPTGSTIEMLVNLQSCPA